MEDFYWCFKLRGREIVILVEGEYLGSKKLTALGIVTEILFCLVFWQKRLK